MHTTSFKIKEVSESVVLKILQNLNPSKATGLDQLSPSLIKDGANIIMSPLTHLFLVTGQIPDDLKSSRVTSIYKKNPVKLKLATIVQCQFLTSFLNYLRRWSTIS